MKLENCKVFIASEGAHPPWTPPSKQGRSVNCYWLFTNDTLHVSINNSWIHGPTEILMPFLNFDNLPQDNQIVFQNSVDNFEIVFKTCLVSECSSPL